MSDFLRIRVLFPLIARLPARIAYPLAQRIGWWGAQNRKNAATAYRNGYLKMYPALQNDPAKLAKYVKASLNLFAKEALDIFRAPHLNVRDWEHFVSIEGLEHLSNPNEDAPQGTLLIMAHYGRLTMLLIRLKQAGFPQSMLTVEVDESNPDLDNINLFYLRKKVRTVQKAMGGAWLQRNHNMRPLYTGLKKGETWVILLDAQAQPNTPSAHYPFLGGQLELPTGLIRIAEKCNARLVYGSIEESTPDQLQARIRPLSPNPSEAFNEAVKLLEHDTQTNPSQWWHWNVLDYIWQPSHHIPKTTL